MWGKSFVQSTLFPLATLFTLCWQGITIHKENFWLDEISVRKSSIPTANSPPLSSPPLPYANLDNF